MLEQGSLSLKRAPAEHEWLDEVADGLPGRLHPVHVNEGIGGCPIPARDLDIHTSHPSDDAGLGGTGTGIGLTESLWIHEAMLVSLFRMESCRSRTPSARMRF